MKPGKFGDEAGIVHFLAVAIGEQSPQKLADLLGITYRSLLRWIAGKTSPPNTKRRQYVELLQSRGVDNEIILQYKERYLEKERKVSLLPRWCVGVEELREQLRVAAEEYLQSVCAGHDLEKIEECHRQVCRLRQELEGAIQQSAQEALKL